MPMVQAELLGSFQNAMILGVLLMMFVLILLFHRSCNR